MSKLKKVKNKLGREYPKLMSKQERLREQNAPIDEELTRKTEEVRKKLRAALSEFERKMKSDKESAWGRLMRGFDEAIDFDKAFPLVLWKMLSAMQKKKASPNGTGNLIAVEPRVAAEFWRKTWADERSEIEREWLDGQIAYFREREIVRASLSNWIGSAAQRQSCALYESITGVELKECAKSLACAKSPGLDGLTNDALRVLPDIAFDELAVVCNRAIRERVLPREWLCGLLKLLPKPNTDGRQAGDYRPICLLSCAFKLFECVLMSRFKRWIAHYDSTHSTPFVSDVQGGFRARRGTLDQVLHLLITQQHYHSLNDKGVLCVFVDIQKAFDSVPHSILLNKMLTKGVPTPFVDMCALLLRGHYCEMNFTGADFERAAFNEGDLSCRIENQKGVIQGSISGPLFWAIFIDDLLQELESVDGGGVELPGIARDRSLGSSWFADDGAILSHTCEVQRRKLDVLTRWAGPNRILFSVKKTLAMWLVLPGPKNAERVNVGNEQLRVHDTLIVLVDSFCYLGMDIVGNGRVTSTCSESKVTRASKRIDQIKCMVSSGRSLSPKLALQMTNAKIDSVLLYGCDVLSPHPDAQKLQHKCLRQILNTYDRTHLYLMFSELGEYRLNTVAQYYFLAGTARIVASPTPIARCAAHLALQVIDLLDAGKLRNKRTRDYTTLLPWQRRLTDCLLTLCGDGENVLGVDIGVVRKLNNKSNGNKDRANGLRVSSELMWWAGPEGDQPLKVTEMLGTLCGIRQSELAFVDGRVMNVTPHCSHVNEWLTLAKCIKQVAKARLKIVEHEWWQEQARLHRTPLSRLPAVGDGQLYLSKFSIQYANIAFLFRTGQFNPPDVIDRFGVPECKLCGEERGDNPLHLLALCDGGDYRVKLLELRQRAAHLFADRFTDWKDVLYGLVAKTRGVSEKHLTRERVEQGCVIFHELYELRRSARRRHVH